MEIEVTPEKNCYIICIHGDLDASSSINMDQALATALSNGEKNILIDCSNLNYISSAGLGVFMSYLKDFESNNTGLVLFNMSEKVKSVFKILGLDELINIVNTKKEAKALCNESTF